MALLVLGCGIITKVPKGPPPDTKKSAEGLDPTAAERLRQSTWWLNPESIEEADKGLKFEVKLGEKKESKPTAEAAPTASAAGKPERVAVVLVSSLALLDTIRESIRQDEDWVPLVHIVNYEQVIDRDKAGALARTVSRRDLLRLVLILAHDREQRLTYILMDGYSGYPLAIENWPPGAKADIIIGGMKKALRRVEANLIRSSRVVQIRDRAAIVAHQPGVRPGDHLNIRQVGEGILDPYTRLQITWSPGRIVTTGRVKEILDNGFMKMALDKEVSGTAEDLLAVKP